MSGNTSTRVLSMPPHPEALASFGIEPEGIPQSPTIFTPSTPSGTPSIRSSSGINLRKRKSTRIIPGTPLDKPWLRQKTRLRFARYLIYAAVLVGMGLAGFLVYRSYRSVLILGELQLVLDDQFDNLDPGVWRREVNVGGFGNGQFGWATDSDRNSWVEGNTLYIAPTLTRDVLDASQIENGYTVNLTLTGTCTSTQLDDCGRVSNSSTREIINPVQSARLNTRISNSIRYGKVEVQARMPVGDWIWPAIWMMPTDDTYGAWPASGEIDLAESRGNGYDYAAGGRDTIASTLHWGPTKDLDRYWKTTNVAKNARGDYSEDFHTYSLEWTPDYLITYIDSRIKQVLSLKTNKQTFWERGEFPNSYINGTDEVAVKNPWVTSTANSAPFDQDFFLILSVGVGGTNGWFEDNKAKPWVNGDPHAMADFYNTTEQWYPTWPSDMKRRAMAVRRVRMWQLK